MDVNTQKTMRLHIEKTIEALKKRNMTGIYVPTVAQVVPAVRQLLDEGQTVTYGGSQSLYQAGVIEHLRGGRYKLLDRDAPGADKDMIQHQAFFADAFLCSANAVTEQGELYNVDGAGNRVAALLYGPRRVILVVGVNKLVYNLEEAVRRVKTFASPPNTMRLSRDTYCEHKGECVAAAAGLGGMTEGCASAGRICALYTVVGWQQNPDRIKVLLVGEPLGY